MVRTVLVLSSVGGGVVDDLVRTLGSVPGWRAELRTAMDGADWRRRRADGGRRGWYARLVGLLFPVRPGLGRACRAADAVVATTNPFWLPAAVAVRAPRTPLVTLVYDVYPESLEVGRTLPRPVRRLVGAIAGLGLRRAAGVVTLGERVRAALVDRHGPGPVTAVIPTGTDPDRLAGADAPDPDLAAALADRVVVGYVGNAGSVHDVATLGAALRAVLDTDPNAAGVVSARGDRAADLLDPVRDHPRCHVLPPLDDDAWRWITARIDVALVGLDAGAALASVPSKVHAALAAGSAVLAVAPDDSDLADLVRTTGAGPVIGPGDVAGATAALRALVADADARARHGSAARAAAWRDADLAARWAAVLADVSAAPTTR